ncbi:hypothetical protein GCM10022409_16110 [Hymenobacter glaciei]|uniref:Uncharacterized protein n=2 Tax=Hymenobacter glaciei TaxID=877209 RepID=A0ABP7TXS5_9BACT
MRKCEREVAPTFTLPPATQTGANTFGFVLDGRVWRNYGWLPYTAAESDNLSSSYVPHGRFTLNAGLIDRNRYERFYLFLDSLVNTGTYRANANVASGATRRAERILIFSGESDKLYYGYSPNGTKTNVTITKLDTVKHIIAGTFEGAVAQRVDSTKQVRITDGRFDIKYQ